MFKFSSLWLLQVFALSAFASDFQAKLTTLETKDAALLKARACGFTVKESIDELKLITLVSSNENADSACLEATGLFEFIERDQDSIPEEIKTPDDQLFEQQDWLKRIQAEKAWDLSTGSYDVLVATVDSGVDVTHPDLKNQLWINPETGKPGWNFIDSDDDVNDVSGHGSHVAGIIGGQGNDKTGITGVNWKVMIMPLKACQRGNCKMSNNIKAIVFAAKHGARVINCSWSGPGPSKALSEAVDFAVSQGAMLAVSAGNDNRNLDTYARYPSRLNSPGLVSVAATQNVRTLAAFSNYGLDALIAAPGVGVLSAGLKHDWVRKKGTSMSSPVVAGIAALMLSVRSDLTPLEVRNGLLNAVVPSVHLRGLTATGGDVNAYRALLSLNSTQLKVWPARIDLKVGRTFQFNAMSPTKSAKIEWRVSDRNLAEIAADGVVTPKRPGSLIVFAIDKNTAAVARTMRVAIFQSTPVEKPKKTEKPRLKLFWPSPEGQPRLKLVMPPRLGNR